MILKKLSKIGGFLCIGGYLLSMLLDQLNIYSLDRTYQGYLLTGALICLGVYLLKAVKQLIFGILCLAAAAAVIYFYLL